MAKGVIYQKKKIKMVIPVSNILWNMLWNIMEYLTYEEKKP